MSKIHDLEYCKQCCGDGDCDPCDYLEDNRDKCVMKIILNNSQMDATEQYFKLMGEAEKLGIRRVDCSMGWEE